MSCPTWNSAVKGESPQIIFTYLKINLLPIISPEKKLVFYLKPKSRDIQAKFFIVKHVRFQGYCRISIKSQNMNK